MLIDKTLFPNALYQSYVQSVLDYGLAAYGTFGANLQPLDPAQYMAACKVSGCTRDTRHEVVYHEAGLKPFRQRLEHGRAAGLFVLQERRRLPQLVKAVWGERQG